MTNNRPFSDAELSTLTRACIIVFPSCLGYDLGMHLTEIQKRLRPVLEAGKAHWAVRFGSWAISPCLLSCPAGCRESGKG